MRRLDRPGYVRSAAITLGIVALGLAYAAVISSCQERSVIAEGWAFEACFECNTDRCWEIPCEPAPVEVEL